MWEHYILTIRCLHIITEIQCGMIFKCPPTCRDTQRHFPHQLSNVFKVGFKGKCIVMGDVEVVRGRRGAITHAFISSLFSLWVSGMVIDDYFRLTHLSLIEHPNDLLHWVLHVFFLRLKAHDYTEVGRMTSLLLKWHYLRRMWMHHGPWRMSECYSVYYYLDLGHNYALNPAHHWGAFGDVDRKCNVAMEQVSYGLHEPFGFFCLYLWTFLVNWHY